MKHYRYTVFVFIYFFLCLFIVHSQEYLPRIAVIPFNYINISKSDTEIITGLFEIALIRTGAFGVIEQNLLNEILESQAYSISDFTDEKFAIEVGKLLSAEQIILGTLSSFAGKYVLYAKIIDVATGKNIRADRVQTESLEKMTEAVDVLASKLAGIIYQKVDIEDKIFRIKKARSIGGWIAFSTGVVSLGLSGLFWYLSNEAFNDYNNTNVTEDVIEYRRKTQLYDALTYSAVGVGVLGLGISISLWRKKFQY